MATDREKVVSSGLQSEWFALPDDLIGGWVVMNVNKPPSECDFRSGEVEYANFTTEALAKHIAELHNKWLKEQRSCGPTEPSVLPSTMVTPYD